MGFVPLKIAKLKFILNEEQENKRVNTAETHDQCGGQNVMT